MMQSANCRAATYHQAEQLMSQDGGLVLRLLSHWKLINVNSQLSKEINFESVFHNLEHVLFCEISPKKFRLWSALIGQSASVYKHQTKRRLRRRCWLSKVYLQYEKCSLSKEKFRDLSFEINFQCERGLTKF